MKEDQLDRIIEMAWEDRTTFEAIEIQFGLTEAEVIHLMRSRLKPGSYRRSRKRVNCGVSMKHLHKRGFVLSRFKSDQQRHISGNSISKRR
ncbi:MAG: TIGR03643 family protein [Flavobacteriales bacterium]|nr:TIGR03643 family protein [Flavobacteriales bacterium]